MTSPYIGPTRHRGRWMAQIRVHGQHVYLGHHATDLEAALAFDAEVRKRGLQRTCNFSEDMGAHLREAFDDGTVVLAPHQYLIQETLLAPPAQLPGVVHPLAIIVHTTHDGDLRGTGSFGGLVFEEISSSRWSPLLYAEIS